MSWPPKTAKTSIATDLVETVGAILEEGLDFEGLLPALSLELELNLNVPQSGLG